MSKVLVKVWELIQPWCAVGDRRILLIPIVFIPVWFTLISKIHPADGVAATLNSALFLVVVIIVTAGSLAYFFIKTRLPPPKDVWVLLVPEFASVSRNKKEREEGRRLRNRIIGGLRERIEKSGLPLQIRTAGAVVDPVNEKDIKLATTLGRHGRAHAVLCASVVFDNELKAEDYRFCPQIVSLTNRMVAEKYLSLNPLELPPEAMESSLRQARIARTGEITDIVNVLAALPLFHRGDYAQFVRVIEPVKNSFADLHHYRAVALMMCGHFRDAAAVALDAIDNDGSNPDSWFAAGLVLMATGERAAALRMMYQVRKLDPTHIGASYARLTMLTECARAQSERAENMLNQIDRLRQDADSQDHAFDLCLQGDTRLGDKDFHGALECFDEALRLDPDCVFVPQGREKALLGIGGMLLGDGDHMGALSVFESVLSMNENSLKARLGKAETLLTQNRVEDALEELDRLRSPAWGHQVRRQIADAGKEAAIRWLSKERTWSAEELWAEIRRNRFAEKSGNAAAEG